MPKVNGKHYSYTPAGMAAAKAAAKKKGTSVKYGKRGTPGTKKPMKRGY